ncbi:MAG: acyloxyacyl hydrolase [Rhodocyclaceae bacterium]|nr:acyloxyacyl hydrolase [Rhodocyclaceae bacterium]
MRILSLVARPSPVDGNVNRPIRAAATVAALLALGVVPATGAQAADLTVATGRTSASTLVVRVGAQFDFERAWFVSDVGRLTGYWDAGYTYWDGGSKSRNHSISLNPVFVYEFTGERFRPYVEGGIGIALFARTEMYGFELSTAFQFEDRLGFGVRFGEHEIGLRAQHYSNANIKRPNDGVEAYTIHYRFRF